MDRENMAGTGADSMSRRQALALVAASAGLSLGPGGVQAGRQVTRAVIDLHRPIGKLLGPVGGLLDPRTGRDHHGQHLIDCLPGDPG